MKQPTIKQLIFIKAIEECLNIEYTGKDFYSAYTFIKEHVDEYNETCTSNYYDTREDLYETCYGLEDTFW